MDNKLLGKNDPADEFFIEIERQLGSTIDKLNQVAQTIDQSQGEVNRLVQRTSLVSSQLQKYADKLENLTKEEIRDSYVDAMDAQQRFLLVRSQVEKLQEQQNQLEATKDFLERLKASYLSEDLSSTARRSKNRAIEVLELLITAQEAERQRLSRQMHDGPAQALSNFIVQAEIATKLFDIDPAKARDELDKLKISAMSAFQKIRNFVAEVRPMMLDDLGLIPTLRKYVANIHETSCTNIVLTLNGSEKKLEPYLEVFIFRTVQELISNAIKRNQGVGGDLKIEVILTLDNSKILLTVMDNGKEFSSEELLEEDGLGLNLIEERVGLLGGTFTIQATPELGVECMITIPVSAEPVK